MVLCDVRYCHQLWCYACATQCAVLRVRMGYRAGTAGGRETGSMSPRLLRTCLAMAGTDLGEDATDVRY
eukprot:1885207-Rhodomonas_salina.1